jgi:hypothetical protein
MAKSVSFLALFASALVGHAQTHLLTNRLDLALIMPLTPITSPLPHVSSAAPQLTPLQELCKAQHDITTNMLTTIETDTNDFAITSNGISVLRPGHILGIGSFDGITAIAVASANEPETVQGSSDLKNWTDVYAISNQFPFFVYIDFAAQPQQFYRTAHAPSIVLSASQFVRTVAKPAARHGR